MGEKMSMKTLSRALNTSYPTLHKLKLTPVEASGNPHTRYCPLYDLDEAKEKLEAFREELKRKQESRGKIQKTLVERGVTSRTQQAYTIGEDLAGYLMPDYKEWRRVLRKAMKSRHKCPVCGADEIGVPIFRTLCQECWCGLLLYFMSFLKDDDRPMCEREDPLVFALRMARNLERKGMSAFEHAARLANPERIGLHTGPKPKKVRDRRKH